MNASRAVLSLLVFPGLLFALPMGWLMLGVERKLRARLQGRLGPPLWQPAFDLLKLLAKEPVARSGADAALLSALPMIAVISMLGALALLPVSFDERGFAGDLVLFIGLLEMPSLCAVLAGYASRSIYGAVGATREAVLGIVANVPMLAAVVALAASSGSLRLSHLAAAAPWPVRLTALVAFALCLPAKLHLNPFSVAHAEQVLLAGPLTEMDGPRLGLWEIARALEWVALLGTVVTLAVPVRSGWLALDGAGFALLALAAVVPLTFFAAATARFKLEQATRWLGRWGVLAAVLALAAAFFAGQGGS